MAQWDNQVIRRSYHGLMKGRFCLTNLNSSYDKMISVVYEGKTVDVVYSDLEMCLTVSPTVFSWRDQLLKA